MADLISLRQIHDGMIEDLRVHYLDRVQTIEAYDPFPLAEGQEPQPIVTPALLVELESIDPGEDDGTDRNPLRLSFAAHLILSFRTQDQQLELREFAADLMGHLRHQRWGFPGAVQAPEQISAQPGEFAPEIEGFDSFLVRWEQLVWVGPDTWAGGIAPEQIWLGFAPKIGAAHVDDYIRLADTSGLPL